MIHISQSEAAVSSDLDHFDAPEEGEGQRDDDQQDGDHGEQHSADVRALTTQSCKMECQAFSRSNHFTQKYFKDNLFVVLRF